MNEYGALVEGQRRRKTYPGAFSFTATPTSTDLGPYPDLCGEWPVTNYPNHSMATIWLETFTSASRSVFTSAQRLFLLITIGLNVSTVIQSSSGPSQRL